MAIHTISLMCHRGASGYVTLQCMKKVVRVVVLKWELKI